MTERDDKAKRPTRRPLAKTDGASTKDVRKSTNPRRSTARRHASAEQRRTYRRSTQETKARYSANAKTVHVTPKVTPREMVESLFRTSFVARVVACALVVLIVVGIGDALANLGKAYPGVTVQGVDVSGLTADEMKERLKTSAAPQIEQGSVMIFSSEEARQKIDDDAARLESEALAEQISIEEARANHAVWTPTAASLGASAKVDEAVKEALSYGRGLGNIFNRLGAQFFGHDISMGVAFDEFAIESLAAEIDLAIGDARIDTAVGIDDGYAFVVDGHDGQLLNRETFRSSIESCLNGENPDGEFIAKVELAPSRITHDQAQAVADKINAQLDRPITFNYNDHPWSPDRWLVGYWVAPELVIDEEGSRIDVSLDLERARPDILNGIFAAIDTAAWNITFEKTEDDVMVYTDGGGTMPNLGEAVSQLDDAMFGNGASTGSIDIEISPLETPESLTFDQARELGLVSIIGSYTTEYSNYEGTENRNYNIHHASDIINNTIAKANGGTWSFNDSTGDTNDETGFKSAGSIVQGEYVDSIGGGICQVATTVFNAVFEAGLPVLARTNHELYIASYPNGRDAAVSYPYLDFEFENDLGSDILLKTSYSDTTLTVTLYSTATGYRVESTEGEWEERGKYDTKFETDESLSKGVYYTKTYGEDGRSITVYRTVYDNKGEVVFEDAFLSVYSPKDELIVVGPDTDTKGLSRSEREKVD